MTVAWIDFEAAPGTSSITDGFAGSAATIDGRVTDTGNKTWDVTDGSTYRVDGSGVTDVTAGVPAIGHAIAWIDAGFSNGTIHADVEPIAESSGFRDGLVFRYVDDLNHWVFFNYRSVGGADQYYFRSYVAGSLSYDSGALTTGARNTGGTIPLEVVLNGTSVKGYYDGVLRVDITNTDHQSATKHGICQNSSYGVEYFSATP